MVQFGATLHEAIEDAHIGVLAIATLMKSLRTT